MTFPPSGSGSGSGSDSGSDGFWERERALGFFPLLEPPHDAPEDYAQEVAQVKRVLECWNIDPDFRHAWQASPQQALSARAIALSPEAVAPLLASSTADELLAAVHQGRDRPDQPRAVRRYCAHLREKLHWRDAHRASNRPTDPRMAAWWQRQIARLSGQMTPDKADAIVHTPITFELCEGCSVGCWFCALASESLHNRIWPATPEHLALWRSLLTTLAAQIGPAVANAFCYWATEPFDNPDYEIFLREFHAVLGRFPQTTTALPTADVERTRALLRQAEQAGGALNRFSILSRQVATQVHTAFSAHELLLTELLPQNRDANPKFRKARAGRILENPSPALTQTPTTIACVSGFLINLWAKRIELIAPCPASARWPKGYWVIDSAQFEDAPEAGRLIERMIARQMPLYPPVDQPVRLRPDIAIDCPSPRQISCRSLAKCVTIAGQPQAQALADLLGSGRHSPAEIAEQRERSSGIACQNTFYLLNHLFDIGLFDEEPAD